MTKLTIRGQTQAEDKAIRSWLEKQGVAVDNRAATVDSEALARAGIDVGRFSDGFDLAALKQATPTLSAGLADKQARELSSLAKKNLLASAESGITSLEAEIGRIDAGQISSRADFSKLAAKLHNVNDQLFKLVWNESANLTHWEPEAFAETRATIQSFMATVARFADAAGRFVEAQGKARPDDAARVQKGVSEAQSAIHVVARDVKEFVPKSELLAEDAARTRERALKFAGKVGQDAAWFDRHFEIGVSADGDEAVIRTTGHLDLDWSGRGLTSTFSGGDWVSHDGNLDLSRNELIGPWPIPSHVTGNLNLSENAYDDLRAFDMHPVKVDGNVDLSNNPNLRDLSLLHHIEVGGDLILTGIPATSLEAWENKPVVGGAIVLHPSQTGLIEDCKRYELKYRVVEDPSFKAFEKPKDPEAWLLGLTWKTFPKEADLLSVLRDMPWQKEARQALGEKIALRVTSPDPDVARAAIALLGRVDHERSEAIAKPYFDQVPEGFHQALPESLARMSTPMLGLVFRELERAERWGDEKPDKANKPPYPSWGTHAPRSERLALELVRRAEAGEAVSLGPLSGNLDDQDRSRDGDLIFGDASVRVVAAQLSKAESEKKELRLTLKNGHKVTLEQAFGELKVYGTTFDAFERALRRTPDNAALVRVYQELKEPGLSDVIYVGSEKRVTSFLEELEVRKKPSKAFAETLEAVQSITSETPADKAKATLADVVKRAGKLSEVEVASVLAELVTSEIYELRHHPSLDVRIEWAKGAASLLPKAGDARRGELAADVFERFMEHIQNNPARSAELGLDRAFVDALEAFPGGGTRGYFVASHSGTLHKSDLGKSILQRFFDETFAVAADEKAPAAARQEAFKAIHRVGNTIIPVITKERANDLAAKLGALKLEGDLAYDRDEVVKVLSR